jgi:hypothetical protein
VSKQKKLTNIFQPQEWSQMQINDKLKKLVEVAKGETLPVSTTGIPVVDTGNVSSKSVIETGK